MRTATIAWNAPDALRLGRFAACFLLDLAFLLQPPTGVDTLPGPAQPQPGTPLLALESFDAPGGLHQLL